MQHLTKDPLSAFHITTKPVGPICNLNCRYCFYLEKGRLYPRTSGWVMSDEVLESYTCQYIEAQQVPVVTFAWQGGEPTVLGVEFFRKAVEFQQRYANGKRIENAFQTNAVLLDDRWCDFLAENEFLVGVSIDGPRELQDHYRVDKGGRPTFDRVMRGIACLKKHGADFNTLTCVQRNNAPYPLDVYHFLKDVGSGFMQFIPVVERVAKVPGQDNRARLSAPFKRQARVSEWSVDADQYGKFLCTIFDEWVRNDVGWFFGQIFDVALESWLGLSPSPCVFRETCGAALAIEHNGDLYACDHFVYPDYRLGNIIETPLKSLVNSRRQRVFGLEKRETLPRYCRNCDVRFACNGDCPKHRFIRTPKEKGG